MARKYCRYCGHMEAGRCRKKGIAISPERARHTNACRDFQLNRIDALRTNEHGYRPQERTQKPTPDGHQITMTELLVIGAAQEE